MPIITIFPGTFCNEDIVLQELIAHTGYKPVTDSDLTDETARLSGIDASKISRAFVSRTSIFNKFTHEKERSIAYLKLALAEKLTDDNLLLSGFSGHLIPKAISHVLRICLIADMSFRIALAAKSKGISEKEAAKWIHRQDEDCGTWVNALFNLTDPWSPVLYDMILPMNKTNTAEAIQLILDNLNKDVLQTTEKSRKTIDDFRISAQVEVALANAGHHVGVTAANGKVTLTINKHVLMLSRLEQELKSIAGIVPGVKSIETGVGKDFHQSDIYRKFDFEVPSKVLLVDDEREFVQTLSERLILRDMGSAVAFDGESALKLVHEEEPEVMILDLKMPGIDGIEVLRRVKETQPGIEVIILTGHGSEADRQTCMNLGAFAYLHKPVDIDILSDTLKKANEKIQAQKKKPEIS
jgi:two-component system, OmpR family, response regulator CpxR